MDLIIRNLEKHYGAVKALDDISLNIKSGSLVCFLGPSGCGKTTLLRAIAGLEDVDKGEITLGDGDLSKVPARLRNFGVVFQSYSLFPHMNITRNISYGLECRRWSKADINTRVKEMLDLVHLADQADKIPSQMSGGQQQRIAIARALAPNPSLLLLDEPLSALDAKVREDLRNEIRSLQQRLGITTIMVTHDQEEALAMADVIVVMSKGKIEQVGSPKELYLNPASSFVADFIGRMNIISLDDKKLNNLSYGDVNIELTGHKSNGAKISRLGIRPEAVTIMPSDSSGSNIIPGTVKSVTYLGNISRVDMVPHARPDANLLVELHGDFQAPEPGNDISLYLPADALKVLL